ncbi:MAG: uroporphyrinogen-III C-methyltransferase [Thermomonas sp.]
MNAPSALPSSTAPPRRSRAGGLLLLLLLLVALAVAGVFGWRYVQQAQAQSSTLASQQRKALDASVARLHTAQQSQAQRLQHAEATNRVLRDELLGIGERATLLEDSISKLVDPDRNSAQALRLDELELLLGIGQQRMQLAGDLDGARRALALAAPLLGGIDDPGYLSLRQTMAQEQAALDTLGVDPRIRANALLDALGEDLQEVPTATAAHVDPRAPWYQRLLDRVVRVQPSAGAGLAQRPDREAALAAMQIELSLARAAVERRDDTGLASALGRIDGWLRRLQPARSARLRQRMSELRAISLRVDAPLAGSTLQQLRALRGQ